MVFKTIILKWSFLTLFKEASIASLSCPSIVWILALKADNLNHQQKIQEGDERYGLGNMFSRKNDITSNEEDIKELQDKNKVLMPILNMNGEQMNYYRDIHQNNEYWKDPVCNKCVLRSSHADETLEL